jgi:hypothetical protein
VLTEGFSEFDKRCGDMLVVLLPTPMAGTADDLLAKMRTLADRRGTPEIGVCAWSVTAVDAWRATLTPDAPSGRRLVRLAEETRWAALREVWGGSGSEEFAHDPVKAAARILHGEPGEIADIAEVIREETLLLRDLAILQNSVFADAPRLAEALRAVKIISSIGKNQNLLRSLLFLPVCTVTLAALMTAEVVSRAVIGLLTPIELNTVQYYSKNVVEYFRGARPTKL